MATAKKSAAKTPAKKSASRKTAATTGAKKASAKKAPAKKAPAKKGSAKKSSGGAQACWPGFEHTPGTTPGEKGSCEPKAKQSGAEKKADSKAAAASKQKKG